MRTPAGSVRPILFLLFLGLVMTTALLATTEELDENKDGVVDQWVETGGGDTTMRKDRDFDGTADYELVYDERARKVYESIDFNYDGEMDDFYYYENGVLTRREIDTDFDGRIDLWVTLSEGVYVARVERDLDGDGKADYVKDYGLDKDR